MLNLKLRLTSFIPRFNLRRKLSCLCSLDFFDFNFSRSISSKSKAMCCTLLPIHANISIICACLELFRRINVLGGIKISLFPWECLLSFSICINDTEFCVRVMRIWIILIVFIKSSNWQLTDVKVIEACCWDFNLKVFWIFVGRTEP